MKADSESELPPPPSHPTPLPPLECRFADAICQVEPYGVGDSELPNFLYNPTHCNMCSGWIREVSIGRLFFLLIFEHLLLFFKVFVSPCTPHITLPP